MAERTVRVTDPEGKIPLSTLPGHRHDASEIDNLPSPGSDITDLDDVPDSAARLAMAPGERVKLGGVEVAATANSSDEQLRDRATHTGTQALSTVAGLQSALAGKQAAGDYVTDTDPRLSDARTPASHVSTHAMGGPDELTPADIGAQPAGDYVTEGDPRLTDPRAPTAHGHQIGDVAGLQNALDGKQPAGSYATTGDLDNGLAGKQDAGDYVTVDDARLTDPRTPISHAASHAAGGGDEITVALSQVSGLISALNAAASRTGVNAQTGITYTLQVSDDRKIVTCSNASAITVTVPQLPALTQIEVVPLGDGAITLVAGPGITVQAEDGLSLATRAKRSVVSLLWLTATDVLAVGGLEET